MEKFFDKLSLLVSGAGFAFSFYSFMAGNVVAGVVLDVVSLLLLFAGMTGGKNKKD
jgi:hypothetical protein